MVEIVSWAKFELQMAEMSSICFFFGCKICQWFNVNTYFMFCVAMWESAWWMFHHKSLWVKWMWMRMPKAHYYAEIICFQQEYFVERSLTKWICGGWVGRWFITPPPLPLTPAPLRIFYSHHSKQWENPFMPIHLLLYASIQYISVYSTHRTVLYHYGRYMHYLGNAVKLSLCLNRFSLPKSDYLVLPVLPLL